MGGNKCRYQPIRWNCVQQLLPGKYRPVTNFQRYTKNKKIGPHHLGIIGGGGLQLLNTKDFSLRKFYIPDTTAFNHLRNAVWDVVNIDSDSYALSTASGFYVLKDRSIHFRHDVYGLKDIGKKRILYGREIFSINKNEFLIYSELRGLSYYNSASNDFRSITSADIIWRNFLPASNDDHWVLKHQLNNNLFLFASYKKDSILLYDHSLKKSVSSPLPFHNYIELSWESKISMLNDSVFTINAAFNGFYLFHLEKNGNITCDGKKYLPAHKITCLFLDKDKRLWAGSDEGLLRQKLKPTIISSHKFSPAPGFAITGSFTTAYCYKDKLYAGRYSMNKGLVIINKSTLVEEKQIDFYGGNNPFNEIMSIEMYHPDTLWVGTKGGIIWFDTKTHSYGKVLDNMRYDWAAGLIAILPPANKEGYAWICSYLGGLVVRYHIASRTFKAFSATTKPALPFDKVKSVAYDSYGDVWISGHSLTRWNNKLQLFDTLISTYGGVNKFNDDILAITADDNGSLWLHNAFNGLLEYRVKEKKFIQYSMKDGLPSDMLQALSPVIKNDLWIGSNSHLSKFDIKTKKLLVFDQYDGVPEQKPSGRRICFDSDHGFLYMCAGEYIVKIFAGAQTDTDSSSNLLIQQLTINDKHVQFQPNETVQLQHDENNLSLKYTVIDFEKNNYEFAYQLNNDGWNNLGGQRMLNLNNIQPGKYLINLKATGKSGIEKLTAIMLTIQPPIWKRTSLIVAFTILLLSIFYYFFRRRIKEIRQKANIDKLLAETEMKALHSQMNPHFIFNSLNSIKEMILNNENNEASRYLSKFAQLIRITLDQSGHSFISLKSTVDYLQLYIEMEKIRNDQFTYAIIIDEELDIEKTILPPMLIQPFIENAIWHGIPPDKKTIYIEISFKKENNFLVCTIDDDGSGIEEAIRNKSVTNNLHKSVGIENIRNRIRLLNEKYGLQSSIAITDKKNIPGSASSGTKVILYLAL